MMRARSHMADALVRLFATVASALLVAEGVQRAELLRKYDAKLYSYNEKIGPFVLSVLPAILAMTCIFFVYRILKVFPRKNLALTAIH